MTLVLRTGDSTDHGTSVAYGLIMTQALNTGTALIMKRMLHTGDNTDHDTSVAHWRQHTDHETSIAHWNHTDPKTNVAHWNHTDHDTSAKLFISCQQEEHRFHYIG